LNVNDTVRIKPNIGKIWIKAIVIKQISPRAYLVESENGQRYRRNRRDLIKTTEEFREDNDMDITNYDLPDNAKTPPTSPIPPSSPSTQPSRPPAPSPPPPRRSQRVRRKPNYLNDYILYKGSLIKK